MTISVLLLLFFVILREGLAKIGKLKVGTRNFGARQCRAPISLNGETCSIDNKKKRKIKMKY